MQCPLTFCFKRQCCKAAKLNNSLILCVCETETGLVCSIAPLKTKETCVTCLFKSTSLVFCPTYCQFLGIVFFLLLPSFCPHPVFQFLHFCFLLCLYLCIPCAVVSRVCLWFCVLHNLSACSSWATLFISTDSNGPNGTLPLSRSVSPYFNQRQPPSSEESPEKLQE